jgi:hypothetical protein
MALSPTREEVSLRVSHFAALVKMLLRKSGTAGPIGERSLWLGYLNVEPQFDGIRADPRFQRLVHAGGLD